MTEPARRRLEIWRRIVLVLSSIMSLAGLVGKTQLDGEYIILMSACVVNLLVDPWSRS